MQRVINKTRSNTSSLHSLRTVCFEKKDDQNNEKL